MCHIKVSYPQRRRVALLLWELNLLGFCLLCGPLFCLSQLTLLMQQKIKKTLERKMYLSNRTKKYITTELYSDFMWKIPVSRAALSLESSSKPTNHLEEWKKDMTALVCTRDSGRERVTKTGQGLWNVFQKCGQLYSILCRCCCVTNLHSCLLLLLSSLLPHHAPQLLSGSTTWTRMATSPTASSFRC